MTGWINDKPEPGDAAVPIDHRAEAEALLQEIHTHRALPAMQLRWDRLATLARIAGVHATLAASDARLRNRVIP